MRPMKTKKFVKVSARRAKEIFENEEDTIYICASKINPDSYRDYTEKVPEDAFSFEAIVDKYKKEKCSYKTGKYPSFFVSRKRQCN